MEEPLSEDSIQELLDELEEEYGPPEPPPPEVEELLRELKSGDDGQARREAAEQLGKLDASNPRIVQALITAGKSDSSLGVREAAMESLRALVHQEYVRRHPDPHVFTRSMKETVVVVDRVYTERYEKDSDYGNDVFYKHFVVVCLPPDDKFDPGCDYHLILQVSEEIWFPLDRGSKVRIRYAAQDPRIALIEGEW